jgi:predicted lipoprotein with Yx(FWY)xxD motif
MSKALIRTGVGLSLAVILAAACSSGGATTTASPAAPSVAASEAPPSSAASEAPPSAAASQPAAAMTVEAKDVGSLGTVLVAGSNGMTVYIFTSDVKDSGKSACSGGCIVKWPALTVAAGETPSGGAGVTGKLGTITREDDGTLQVTYNGLPLYFYEDDKAPGDANGVYTGWEAVKP